MLKEGVVLDSSFDWLRVLKFRMDIRNVLRAKTTVTESTKQTASPSTSSKSTPRRAPPGSRLKRQADGECSARRCEGVTGLCPFPFAS